nr:hypothetical protein [Spongiactinospora rosea]
MATASAIAPRIMGPYVRSEIQGHGPPVAAYANAMLTGVAARIPSRAPERAISDASAPSIRKSCRRVAPAIVISAYSRRLVAVSDTRVFTIATAPKPASITSSRPRSQMSLSETVSAATCRIVPVVVANVSESPTSSAIGTSAEAVRSACPARSAAASPPPASPRCRRPASRSGTPSSLTAARAGTGPSTAIAAMATSAPRRAPCAALSTGCREMNALITPTPPRRSRPRMPRIQPSSPFSFALSRVAVIGLPRIARYAAIFAALTLTSSVTTVPISMGSGDPGTSAAAGASPRAAISVRSRRAAQAPSSHAGGDTSSVTSTT